MIDQVARAAGLLRVREPGIGRPVAWPTSRSTGHPPTSRTGAIEVKKKKLHIEAVQPGAEADLRHLLASAFLQANAGTDDDESTDDAPTSSRSESDQALTDAFRAFSEP